MLITRSKLYIKVDRKDNDLMLYGEQMDEKNKMI